ncbi:hypothetical protein CEB3_c43320 [Peptococcaceae bacterium CEB3]|nr:hypothetical protein CEB3_c43320 [Peptococcaceae bacterium CEB3]
MSCRGRPPFEKNFSWVAYPLDGNNEETYDRFYIRYKYSLAKRIFLPRQKTFREFFPLRGRGGWNLLAGVLPGADHNAYSVYPKTRAFSRPVWIKTGKTLSFLSEEDVKKLWAVEWRGFEAKPAARSFPALKDSTRFPRFLLGKGINLLEHFPLLALTIQVVLARTL